MKNFVCMKFNLCIFLCTNNGLISCRTDWRFGSSTKDGAIFNAFSGLAGINLPEIVFYTFSFFKAPYHSFNNRFWNIKVFITKCFVEKLPYFIVGSLSITSYPRNIKKNILPCSERYVIFKVENNWEYSVSVKKKMYFE